jgi:hypothetical protein
VMFPHSVAESPCTIPPCICASTESGLMTRPQSIAQATLSTPIDVVVALDISTTSATTVPKASAMAMPRAWPEGSVLDHPPRFTAASSTSREAWVVDQDTTAVEVRIEVGRVGDLVNEALEDEGVIGVVDRSPEADGDGRGVWAKLDETVGHCIGEVGPTRVKPSPISTPAIHDRYKLNSIGPITASTGQKLIRAVSCTFLGPVPSAL